MSASVPQLVEDARKLVGMEAVLVPIGEGTKKPIVSGYLEFTIETMADPKHLARFGKANAVGVLLGSPSGNLVAIDLDDDEAGKQFLKLNHQLLGDALRTRGARGFTIWIRCPGAYPQRVVPLKDANGNHLGEWRGGGYSIVTGTHENGECEYTVVAGSHPKLVAFEDLRWPPEWSAPTPMQKNSSSSAWVSHSPSSSKGHPATPAGTRPPGSPSKIWGYIAALKKKYIKPHWIPTPGERNRFIVEAVPFLYTTVSVQALSMIVMGYFDENSALWRADRATHQHELEEHLRNVADRYYANLSPAERKVYDRLTRRQQEAFRICRYLAERRDRRPDCRPGRFFLAYGNLGRRLLVDSKTASGHLQALIRARAIRIVENGERRRDDVKPKATVWRYLLA